MKNKKRILFCGEATYLSTGFAKFQKEVMERLHSLDKYVLAELGSYGHISDPRAKTLPWKFYGVLPVNDMEKKIYESAPHNQFGKYKLDAVLAEFQPDIVIDLRDPWMFEHLVASRFKDNYKLILTPTVDSAPQKREWIEGIFRNADILTTYSRYGKKVLEEAGLKVSGVTSPGVDLNLFRPMERAVVRDKYHITPTLLVFGTVMRNQKRKLFPELFESYKKLRDKHTVKQNIARIKEKQKSGKTLTKEEVNALRIDHSVLYCHTSWPDMGWNIPEYLARFQLQRHVIFTYKCDACKEVYASWFIPCNPQGLSKCRQCGEHKAHMPSTHSGVDEDKLAEIMNLFDVYVHPAICEGWGLPIMESKSCGVPGIYQNYSAMEDHVENGGGLALEVGRFFYESETGAIRSLPDNADCVKKMELLAFDEGKRKKLGAQARECAEKKHNWIITASMYEKIIDELPIKDRSTTWDREPVIETLPSVRPPDGLGNQDFVAWLYINILGRAPDEKGFNDWMANLEKGGKREEIERFFREEISSKNKFEEVRWLNSLKNRNIKIKVQAPVENDTVYIPGAAI